MFEREISDSPVLPSRDHSHSNLLAMRLWQFPSLAPRSEQ